jgi:hypothetical protein
MSKIHLIRHKLKVGFSKNTHKMSPGTERSDKGALSRRIETKAKIISASPPAAR